MSDWLKIVVVLGMAAMLFVPCDPACDCTIGTDLAIVLEQETGSFRPIQIAQPIMHQPRRYSSYVESAVQSHSKEVFSIIDLTCARLC